MYSETLTLLFVLLLFVLLLFVLLLVVAGTLSFLGLLFVYLSRAAPLCMRIGC